MVKTPSAATRMASFIGLALLAFLFLVWPIPRTISVRDVSILLCIGIYAYLFFRARPHGVMFGDLRLPVVIYVLLFFWLIAVALWVSPETMWSLNEIRGQWLKATIVLVLGGLVALSSKAESNQPKNAIIIVVAVLSIHVLYLDLNALISYAQTGQIPTRINGLTDGPDRINFLTNMLLGFLLTEILFRTLYHKRVLPLGNVVLFFLALASLFSIYVAGVRNGVLTFFFLAVTYVIFSLSAYRSRTKRPVIVLKLIAVVVVVGVIGVVTVKSDSRWQELMETAPIALDTENHKAWLNWEKYPLPRLANGKIVEHSNYTRIAWAKEGILLIMENPWGVGFGRNAFGHALRHKYNEGRGHSHSGIIDFAIGAGIPGALLWIGLLTSLLLLAVGHFKREQNYYAVILIFLLVDFGTRMIVDSVIRDHMLQQFLFLVGLLAVLMLMHSSAASRTT